MLRKPRGRGILPSPSSSRVALLQVLVLALLLARRAPRLGRRGVLHGRGQLDPEGVPVGGRRAGRMVANSTYAVVSLFLRDEREHR